MRRGVWVLRSVLAICLVAVAALVGATFAGSPAHASTDLIGWTSQADANTVDIVVDNTSGLSGIHPLSEVDLPEDTSDFESGPYGYGLASVLWPGAVAGNVGSLSGELPIPSQLAPLFGDLNDPVKAESYYPAGPTQVDYPSGNQTGAVEMSSQATANGISAKAGLGDIGVAGLLSLQSVQGSTTATASDVAQSTASGSFSSLSLLGGLITVGATTSSATAESDGLHPSGTSQTHIGAITVLGHSVSVGSDGLVVGPATATGLSALTAPTTALVNQLIGLIDLKMMMLPQQTISQAPAEQITSAGLQISFSLPAAIDPSLDCSALNSLPSELQQLSVICTLPGLIQGASLTLTLARVTAQAVATPPFGSGPSSTPITPNGAGTVPTASSPSASGTSTGGTGNLAPTTAGSTGSSVQSPSIAGTSTPASSQPRPEAPVSSGPPTSLITASLSSPVKAGLLVFLLILAATSAVGLVQMGRVLEAPPKNVCLLEEQN